MSQFEWMIAKRYVFSKKRIQLIGIISKISIVGVTVGVAALIVVLSVFNGFSSLVQQLLKGVDPDIRIEAADQSTLAENDSLLWSILKNHPEVKIASRFVEAKAVLAFENKTQVAYIHGVEADKFNEFSQIPEHTQMGVPDLKGDSEEENEYRGMLIGIGIADKLGIPSNVTISVISPVGLDRVFTQMQSPRVRELKVTGIYSVQRAYDIGFSYVEYGRAQDIFRIPGQMTGVELRLNPGVSVEDFKETLQKSLGNKYWVQTWYDLRREMYSVMQLEKWGAYLILALIIVVAAFNSIGTLMMTVIEKRKDIGVLMAMGASREQIYRIFLRQGWMVGVAGVIIGSVLGYGIVFLQLSTGFYKIPNAASFIIDAFPVAVEWSDFFATTAMALVLTSVSAIYPARAASKLLPVEAIRYE